MKKVFIIAAFAGLMACNNKPEVCIMGTQSDFTRDQVDCHPTDPNGRFVSDSVYLNNQAYIDSLTTVTELLDHLETLPTE